MLVEQHFESCVLNTQNASKSVGNQMNSLDTSKNEENFPLFPGLRICSIAKNKNPEMSDINRIPSNKETPIVNGYHYYKTAKKLRVWYLSTNLASIKNKTTSMVSSCC